MENVNSVGSKTIITCHDQEFLKTIRHLLNEQRKEGKYCDFTLKTEDGGSFTVHKCILEPTSPFFNKLFNSKFRDSNADSILLVKVSSSVLEKIIEFMYTWEVEIPNDMARELLDISLFLRLDFVVDNCTQILVNSVNLENCLDLLAYSETYHRAEELTEKCATLVLSDLETIMNKNKFVKISSDSMRMLLSHDLIEYSEEQLYLAVVKWIIFDVEKREEFIRPFMDKIKFEHITYEFVLSNILKNNPLLKNEEFNSILADIVSKSVKKKIKVIGSQSRSTNICAVIGHELLLYDNQKHSFTETVTKMNNCKESTGYSVFKGQNIFVCGGGPDSISTNSEYFSMQDKCWNTLPPMKIPRCGHRVITLNDQIYVCGGVSEKSVEIFDVSKEVWSKGPSFDNSMDFFGLCTLNDCIYAVDDEDFQRLDPREGSWVTLPSFTGTDSFWAAVSYNDSIFGFTYDGINTFDIKKNEWMKNFVPFAVKYNRGPQACLINNEIFILGRYKENKTLSLLMHSHDASDLSYRFSSIRPQQKDEPLFAIFTM